MKSPPSSCPVHAHPPALADAFDPFSAEYLANPYAFFAQARDTAPAFYSQTLGYWVMTRYADIKAALKDHELFSSYNSTDPFTPISAETARVFREGGYGMKRILLNNVPPDHTRVRKHVYAAFTPHRIAKLEPKIRDLATTRVQSMLSQHVLHKRADIVQALTYELPALVIFALLGLSDDDVPAVKAGSESRVLFTWGKPSAEQQTQLARDMVAFWQLSEQFVNARLSQPQDDFTSDLIRSRDHAPAGQKDAVLSIGEIVSVVFGLLLAGHETTTGLLTNGLRQLLARPTLWAQLVSQPALIPAAVEEILRHDTSVIAMRRLTTREAKVGDVTIPAHANVLLLIGAGNHDKSVFADPADFDTNRPNAREHLSFGFGIHYCIGAPLARLEARVVFEVLAKHMPSLTLEPNQQYEFLPNTSFRGPRQLWVHW
jgi:hypothetical protein